MGATTSPPGPTGQALVVTAVDPTDREAVRAWNATGRTAFLASPATEEELDDRLREFAGQRLTAVHDTAQAGAPVVATLRSFDTEVTMPGSGPVSADGVTSAAVLPTHRRRGLLSTMLTADLERARRQGHAFAALVATEAPVYGRFGFGVATRATTLVVDDSRVEFRPEAPAAGGTLELVPAQRTGDLAVVHDTTRRARAGGLLRPASWWSRADRRGPGRMLGATGQVVLHRDEHGVPDGYAAYDVTDAWAGRVPNGVVDVVDLAATTPGAYRALWEFLTSIDLTRTTRARHRPVDELLAHLLVDPRAVQTGPVDDFLWLRVLDVTGALAARRYLGCGSLVLQVTDPLGLAGATVHLHVAPQRCGADGWVCAEVTATSAAPDVVLGIGELASLLLGGTSAVALHRAGRLECTASTAFALQTLFATPDAPWCPTWF